MLQQFMKIRPFLSLKWLSLILIILVIPLYTKWIPATLSPLEVKVYGFQSYGDIFAHSKSVFFVTLCGAGLLALIIGKIQSRSWGISREMIPLIIIAILVLLSGVFSPYFPVTLVGVIERYESMWVQLGYLILFGLAATTIKTGEDSKVVENLIHVQMAIIGLICLGQYYGFNLLNWEPIRTLITNPELAGRFPVIAVNSDMAYGTLGNPGNLAQYCSFLLPMLTCLALRTQRNSYWRTGVMVLGWFSVFASGAGSAILGAGIGTVAGMIILRLRGELAVGLQLAIPMIGGLLLALPGIRPLVNGENMAIFVVLVAAGIISAGQYKWANVLFGNLKSLALGLLITVIMIITIIILAPGLHQEEFIQHMELADGQLRIETLEGQHGVRVSGNEVEFYGPAGEVIPHTYVDGAASTDDPSVNGLEYSIEQKEIAPVLVMHRTGMMFAIKDRGLQLLDKNGLVTTLENPPAIGFKGQESLFSCRGYIWSRSIPLLFRHPILGVGSDAFVFAFPQGDYAGKFNVFGTPYMLIDKPHSFYLQYGIQQGIPALLILAGICLISMGRGTLRIVKAHILPWEFPYIPALIGFLVAGIFNDSLVHTTLFFWVSLGVLYPKNGEKLIPQSF